MHPKQSIIGWFCILITFCCQVLASSINEQPFAAAAMTTVLARPLGGYGLTPLVFEPHQSSPSSFSSSSPPSSSSSSSSSAPSLMQGSSSNSVPTKVRKSPVYELIMPNYDEESPASTTSSLLPSTTPQITTTASDLDDLSAATKTLKKMDYESIVSANKQALLNNNNNHNNAMVHLSSPAAAMIAPAASSSQDYYSSMLDLLKASSSSYNSVPASASLPAYKENAIGSMFSQNPFQQHPQQQLIQPMRSFSGGQYSSSGSQGPYTAAIQSVRSVELNDVQDSYENSEPQVIDIPPSAMPIVINFRTSASQIQIHQSHEPSEQREVQETSSQDEPHFLKHSVTKPVIQEVHEIIMPYRRIIQEIRPVEEEVKTIVARNSGGGGGGGGGLGGGFGGGIGGGHKAPLGGLVGGGGGLVGAISGDQLIGAGIAIKQGGRLGGGASSYKGSDALAYAMNKLTGSNKYKSS